MTLHDRQCTPAHPCGDQEGHLPISFSARAVHFQRGTHFCGALLSATTFSLPGIRPNKHQGYADVVRCNSKQREMQMLTFLLNSEVVN